MTLLAIVLFCLTLGIDLYTDIDRWKENMAVNHKRGALLRLIGLVPVCIILGWKFVPLVGFLYWFLFDGLYNVWRGFNWWFTGSDDADDATTDNILQQIPNWLHIITKTVGIILSIIIVVM
jgi:hypothetical protein